jgi:hypothetical protein
MELARQMQKSALQLSAWILPDEETSVQGGAPTLGFLTEF